MKSLLIYDSDILPNKGLDKFDCILTWQYLTKSSKYDHIEILSFLEGNKNEIRKRYLRFIDNISENNIKGKKLKELLLIDNTFPCWEMSLLNEKSNTKSPNISHLLRIIALEIWLEKNKFNKIYLFTDSLELTKSIFSLCEINSLHFNCKKISTINSLQFLKRIKIFYEFTKKKPILWLIYFCLKRFPILITNKKNVINLQNKVLFISYLFNINKNDLDKSYGIDSFWTPLCRKIAKEGNKLNYLLLFAKSNCPRNIFQGINFINIFNKFNHNKSEVHLIDSFLSFEIILETLTFFQKAKAICSDISPSNILKLPSGVNVYHLLAKDWDNSFQGKLLMQNALYSSLLKNICKRIINPEKVFYLLENQNWEFALILNFRQIHSNIPLYGYCHSALRFWDLRYYSTNKFNKKEKINLSPTKFITNGPQATNLLIASGLKKEKIIELEALRYLEENQNNSITFKDNLMPTNKILKIIIMGDYDDNNDKRIFDLINNLTIKTRNNLKFFYKPHPINQIKKSFLNDIQKINTNKKISILLKEYDLAICSSFTTAALECYLSGIYLGVVLEKDSPIMSPVYNLPYVQFILNSSCLERFISSYKFVDYKKLRNTEIFNTNNKLILWENFLNNKKS